MGKALTQWATNAADQATGGILGIVAGGINDRRQLKQQKKLQELEMSGQRSMTDYNMMKQLEMWEKTGYGAQMKQLKEAGLNPGLIYGMGGAGGQSSNIETGKVTGGSAPTGGGEIPSMMGMGIQRELLQAQKANIEANTDLTKAQAAKTGGVDTELGKTQIADLTQGIENKKAIQTLTEVQTGIAKIEARIKGETADDAIELVSWEEQQAGNKVEQLYRDNVISKATMNEKIDRIKVDLAGAVLQNEMTRAQTTNVGQQTQVGIAQVKEIIQRMVISMREDGRNVYGQNLEATQKSHEQWINDVAKSTGLGADIVEKVLQAIILKNVVQRNPLPSELPPPRWKK